jgi:hypothetical protein
MISNNKVILLLDVIMEPLFCCYGEIAINIIIVIGNKNFAFANVNKSGQNDKQHELPTLESSFSSHKD